VDFWYVLFIVLFELVEFSSLENSRVQTEFFDHCRPARAECCPRAAYASTVAILAQGTLRGDAFYAALHLLFSFPAIKNTIVSPHHWIIGVHFCLHFQNHVHFAVSSIEKLF
jgi:hypothetical protein